MDLMLSAVILQAGDKPAQSPLGPFIPIVAIFAIFYFLLIRPQQKRQKEQQAMLKAIVKGDDVVTAGGIHGKVTGVTDDVLTLDIASIKGGERVRVKVARNRVDSVAKKKGDDS
jgi:preprotein translocase subunit YajC